MADLYLTPAERYTAALGGFYYGDLPEPGTVYTQLIKDILDGATPDKEPKNILARFIYSLYISDLGDPYPRYELAKLLYWKLHDITPTKSGSILTVTIDGKEDYMTINTDLSRLWYKVLFGSKTDVITEFPYIFNTMQTKLSDWELFGNTEVSGTPTPDSPVMPQGTGERTGNLFDSSTIEVGGLSPSTGAETTDNTRRRSGFISVEPSTNYGLSREITSSGSFFWVIAYDENKNIVTDATISAQYSGVLVQGTTLTVNQWTFTTTPTTKYIRWYVTVNNSYKNIMLNLGSTPLPYEPWGIKIPISSASTTTPVYMGEVETTRKIKKLVLDGTENWTYSSAYTRFMINLQNVMFSGIRLTPIICTHYITIDDGRSIDDVPNNAIYMGGSVDLTQLFIKTDDYTTAADFKAYLAAQYSAGTPVTVWYVLATEETAVVNEPLMKIGDYADSMSRTQTGADIPTVVGQNTLDVLTTVKPSSMSIEYTSAEENQSRSKRISLLKSPLKKGLIK